MTKRRQGGANHAPVESPAQNPAAQGATMAGPHSAIYELLAKAGHDDAVRREQFYAPFLAEIRAPNAFPRSMDFLSFAGRQLERLKAELGDSHLYDEEKPFLKGLLVAAAVLVLNMKFTEADAALHQAFRRGSKKPRLDLLNQELKKLLDQKPDLTAAGVVAAWADEITRPECVQEVDEDGTVNWYVGPGDERTTSADGITKRLQRLRKKETHR